MIIKQRDTGYPNKDMLPGLPSHACWYSDLYTVVREGREVCSVALEGARTKPVGLPNEPVREVRDPDNTCGVKVMPL